MTGCASGIRLAMLFLSQVGDFKIMGCPIQGGPKKVNKNGKAPYLHSWCVQFESRTGNQQQVISWFSISSTSCQVLAHPFKIVFYLTLILADRRPCIQSDNSMGFVHCNSSLWDSKQIAGQIGNSTWHVGPQHVLSHAFVVSICKFFNVYKRQDVKHAVNSVFCTGSCFYYAIKIMTVK